MDPIRPSGPLRSQEPINPAQNAKPATDDASFGESVSASGAGGTARARAEQPEFAAQSREIAELRSRGLGTDEIRKKVIERHLSEFLGESPDQDMLESIEARVRDNPAMHAMFSRLLAGSNNTPQDSN